MFTHPDLVGQLAREHRREMQAASQRRAAAPATPPGSKFRAEKGNNHQICSSGRDAARGPQR